MLTLAMYAADARDCVPHLRRAAADAMERAESARTYGTAARWEDASQLLGLLADELERAAGERVAEVMGQPPADCDPVTGQEYGTGA